MTTQQEKAYNEAQEILRRNFDAFVMIVCDDMIDVSTEVSQNFGAYDGGLDRAVGLCHLYEARWTATHLKGEHEE